MINVLVVKLCPNIPIKAVKNPNAMPLTKLSGCVSYNLLVSFHMVINIHRNAVSPNKPVSFITRGICPSTFNFETPVPSSGCVGKYCVNILLQNSTRIAADSSITKFTPAILVGVV